MRPPLLGFGTSPRPQDSLPLTFSGMDGRRPESGATKQESWWGAMGGGTDQSGVGLTWVPNLTGSPVLLTGQLFPGAGGGMLCALETVTPLPWERGVAVCPQGWGPQGWGAAPPSTQGGRPGTGGYSPARLRPES